MGKVKCLNCEEVLESKVIWDKKVCGCRNKTSVAGDGYVQIGGKNLKKVVKIWKM